MKALKLTLATIAIMTSVSSFSQQEKPKPSPEKIFKKFDKNEDGAITKDELEGKKILARFEKIDKDSNGSISLEEFKKSMNKVKGKGKAEGAKPKKKKVVEEEDNDGDDA
ncbi:EF-hand domain-containing protein [Flavicella sediminum]|uniref:EF-hand domain-containing protein n=1 Tax=Flavicella sediminum TaxID=2585141 RepID=UPI0011206C78|nr:EF-hand domain-containing protein [Flavicella sediminum]